MNEKKGEEDKRNIFQTEHSRIKEIKFSKRNVLRSKWK